MAHVVNVHELRLKIETDRLGVNQMRKVLAYTYRHAVIGATDGPYSRENKLAASLTPVGPILGGGGVSAHIFSPLNYAASVEVGAKIHPIFPKAAPHVYRFGAPPRIWRRRPQLRFIWRGRLVFTPHVPMSISRIGRSHPGQKGRHFMRKALERASVRYQMVFIPGIMAR